MQFQSLVASSTKSMYLLTSPNSPLFYSIRMEDTGLGKICPSFSPSVHSADGSQAQGGVGSRKAGGFFRIRLQTG